MVTIGVNLALLCLYVQFYQADVCIVLYLMAIQAAVDRKVSRNKDWQTYLKVYIRFIAGHIQVMSHSDTVKTYSGLLSMSL